MITIKSKREGFRRCGMAHSVAPVSCPDDRFSAEELAILQAEPMLNVSVSGAADPEERARRLADACAGLIADREIREHWMADGRPQARALEMLSGEKKVTAAERDAAWEIFSKKDAD